MKATTESLNNMKIIKLHCLSQVLPHQISSTVCSALIISQHAVSLLVSHDSEETLRSSGRRLYPTLHRLNSMAGNGSQPPLFPLRFYHPRSSKDHLRRNVFDDFQSLC